MPMPWTSEVNGGFCSNISSPWMPMNVLINSSISVEKRQGMLQRIQELTSFRRHNLTPEAGEKRGNYLFHYINDGQIVMERYFERKVSKRKQDSASSNKKKRSATLQESMSSQEKEDSKNQDEQKRRSEIKQEVKEEESVDNLHKEDSMKRSSISGKGSVSEEGTSSTEVSSTEHPTSKTEVKTHEVRAEALKSINDSSSSRSTTLSRFRYVVFANLGSTPKLKDLRDKFHLGSIKVTSNPKRMRDFLYFRSLKLDPGEAIIAQVE